MMLFGIIIMKDIIIITQVLFIAIVLKNLLPSLIIKIQIFLVDPDKRARYLEKFCGVLSKKDFNVGENIYNFLKQNNQ